MFTLFKKQEKFTNTEQSFIFSDNEAQWTNKDFSNLAKESYCKNVIAHRCITMISRNASSIPINLFLKNKNGKKRVNEHKILSLLNSPNPYCSGIELLEEFYAYNLICGESYILATNNHNGEPIELNCLRPDFVKVINDKHGNKNGYLYEIGERKKFFPIDKITGKSDIITFKNFHPLSKNHGVSQIEAAMTSIDQHNQASNWNQTLLQNSARPSGALIMSAGNLLTKKQYDQLKEQISECFSGANNSGKPLLLEGGLEWKELGLTPKDMDFIESKNTAAREIALALGVPPQLLGIPGDNTYSNFQEARLAFWEDTILPYASKALALLSSWFSNIYQTDFILELNTEQISSLSQKREMLWSKLENSNFLTINEKRQILGFPPLKEEKQNIS
jgi:HK97 family phage portal protein